MRVDVLICFQMRDSHDFRCASCQQHCTCSHASDGTPCKAKVSTLLHTRCFREARHAGLAGALLVRGYHLRPIKLACNHLSDSVAAHVLTLLPAAVHPPLQTAPTSCSALLNFINL